VLGRGPDPKIGRRREVAATIFSADDPQDRPPVDCVIMLTSSESFHEPCAWRR